MSAGETADGQLEAALNRWLRAEAGVDRPRRVVRAGETEILVSKFEPGFAARLHELLDLMPELFDEASVVAACARTAAALGPGVSRVAAWHEAMHGMLRDAGERHAIPDLRLAEVRTAIDSVHAVLLSVLWSDPPGDPAAGDAYEPLPGEVAAYREGLARLDPSRDLFTRYYGVFDGRLVVNHCPGALFARLMLAHAWRACTGTPPPDASPDEGAPAEGARPHL